MVMGLKLVKRGGVVVGMDFVPRKKVSVKPIKVTYRSVDGASMTRRYATLAGARKWAHEMVGEHPDMGSWYAVSFDGIGRVTVEGASLAELFPVKGGVA